MQVKHVKTTTTLSYKLERLASKHYCLLFLLLKVRKERRKERQREESFPMYVDQAIFGN